MKKQANPLVAKAFEYGTSTLSDQELLSMVVGDRQAAYAVLDRTKSFTQLSTMYLSELAKLPGVTQRMAATIGAIFELHRRRASENIEKKQMLSSHDVAEYIKAKIGDNPHEVFMVLFLNRANRLIHEKIVSQGGITGTVCDPRLILALALDYKAVGLILAHNHPSGSLKPSLADEELTRKVRDAAKLFDIKVLDHVIVSQDGYYSFGDEGIL